MRRLEDKEQIALFQWIRFKPELMPFCFSIPNERKTSAAQGYRLKQMGLRPGVSDIFIGISRGPYHGMFLELKAGKNKPTALQLQFMKDMKSQAYYCTWCTGCEEAIAEITKYLALEKLYF